MSSAPPVGVPPPPPFSYNVSSLTVEQYFGYSPSLGLAWTAAGLFLAVAVCIAVQVCFPSHAGGRAPTLTRSHTLSHTLTLPHAHPLAVQLLIQRNRNSRYVWILVMCALAECGGYIALLWMIYATGTTSLYSGYVAMQALIVLTPNFIQAVVYRTVGQVARVGNVSEKGGCLSAKFISLFFIAIDVACLVVQAIGIAIVRVATCSLLSTCTAFLTRRDLRFALAHSPVGHREEQR